MSKQNYIYDEVNQLKTCGRCKETKPFKDFNKRDNKNGGPIVQSYCKQCCTENARIRRAGRSIYGYSHDEIQWYIELKEQPCTDCGHKEPYYCNDWDHLDNKAECVSELLRARASKDQVLLEIAKCELVCAVCHRKRTHNRKETKKNLPPDQPRRGS